jgi:hypothetical protein
LKGIAMADIDSTLLHQYFEYKDGELYNKKSRYRVRIGQKLGYVTNSDGYVKLGLLGKYYCAHRLIFMMFYGYMPKRIDHIDGNPANNRIENLREVTNVQNCQNSKKRITNTSGYKNVNWRKDRQHWRVDIKINGKSFYFGSYDDIELANLVAIEARNKYHGEFARHK